MSQPLLLASQEDHSYSALEQAFRVQEPHLHLSFYVHSWQRAIFRLVAVAIRCRLSTAPLAVPASFGRGAKLMCRIEWRTRAEFADQITSWRSPSLTFLNCATISTAIYARKIIAPIGFGGRGDPLIVFEPLIGAYLPSVDICGRKSGVRTDEVELIYYSNLPYIDHCVTQI